MCEKGKADRLVCVIEAFYKKIGRNSKNVLV